MTDQKTIALTAHAEVGAVVRVTDPEHKPDPHQDLYDIVALIPAEEAGEDWGEPIAELESEHTSGHVVPLSALELVMDAKTARDTNPTLAEVEGHIAAALSRIDGHEESETWGNGVVSVVYRTEQGHPVNITLKVIESEGLRHA